MGTKRLLAAAKLAVTCFMLLSVAPVRSQNEDATFWNDQAKLTLQKALHRERTLNKNVAKNVVVFVGDGMGISTVTASRILKGQQAGKPGEETVLEWEKFPDVALSKTYGVDKQVVSSGASATAMFCGVKGNDLMVGLDSRARIKDCDSARGASVDSFLVIAHREGKATGFVTTARVTHATPAALYAHSPSRYWESDVDLSAEQAAKGCKDIGAQLAENGKLFEVILGGGRRELISINTTDPEYPDEVGRRTDGRNIIEEWVNSKPLNQTKYVWNLDDLNDIDPKETSNLIGLFERSHLHYELDRPESEPSITDLVIKAIQILQTDPDGFVLVVEGARIDHAHHAGNAARALHDCLAFEKAVAKAIELTNEEDTLVIVTADHSHVMTLGIYPTRGNPILGLYDAGQWSDGMSITPLMYADGPGGKIELDSILTTGVRRNLTLVDTQHPDFIQPALSPLDSESHSGEDVAIYANGPMSHLFHGVHEQNYIAHVVRYAACLDTKEHCETSSAPSRGRLNLVSMTLIVAIAFYISFTS